MYRPSLNNILLAICLVGFAIAFRLIPHPANFAPIGALALVSGAILPRKYAYWLPLAAIALSDLVIGTHNLILWTWGSFALISILSSTFLKGKKIGGKTVVAAGLSSGLLFFVITNFGVWAQSGMYAHTWSGLVQCYFNAIPFLRNTLLGDIFFASTFYAIYLATVGYKTEKIAVQS